MIVVRDDDDGVDLAAKRPADGTVVRIAEVRDLRSRRVEGAFGDLGHLVLADDQDLPSL
ncbi:MAG: hypothetical protein H0V57_07535 [Thermoleophilaceae bacterium]|nr:hypothetical protein [Thermoleophilaceae bacterium]